MTFLCDTNIISELARPQPNPGVLVWSTHVSSIFLSVITLEEITYGLTSKPNTRVQNWFNQFLNTYCQIMPITDEIAQRCGELRGNTKSGLTIPDQTWRLKPRLHKRSPPTRTKK